MSNLLFKWVLGKAVGKVHVGGTAEDPFFEEIPTAELGHFRKQGAKRKKPVPAGLSANDASVLKSVRSQAYQLDLAFGCCCGLQIGWAGIIGLLPWVGDFIAVYFSMALVKKARQIDGGLPAYLEAQMTANVFFDFCVGLIPIVGDLINIAYKANTRNCVLLETHLKQHAPTNNTHEMTAQRELHADHPKIEELHRPGTNSEAFQRV